MQKAATDFLRWMPEAYSGSKQLRKYNAVQSSPVPQCRNVPTIGTSCESKLKVSEIPITPSISPPTSVAGLGIQNSHDSYMIADAIPTSIHPSKLKEVGATDDNVPDTKDNFGAAGGPDAPSPQTVSPPGRPAEHPPEGPA